MSKRLEPHNDKDDKWYATLNLLDVLANIGIKPAEINESGPPGMRMMSRDIQDYVYRLSTKGVINGIKNKFN